MTSALSDYDALALVASWECIEALRDLYCIACIQQMQNKHQPKSSSMLQSQAKPSNLLQSQAADFEKDADGPGCRGSPYVATASVQTAPSSTKLRSLASAQSRSRENVARCRWKNTAACAQCAAQPPLRLRPPVEKCPSVEKQVSAR